jgi:predicted nucleic acid-binding protein
VRALLDANVLISAAIRPSGTPGLVVPPLLERDAFELVLSPSIIAEAGADGLPSASARMVVARATKPP